MKQLTWEEYYDGFYGWSSSTQKSYAYRLSDYGPADEVWEIAEELDFVDSAFAAKFLEKAFSAGVRFTPEQVLEMVAMVDQSLLSKMAEQTTVPFNREQLEEIYLMIDDFSFRKISRRSRIDVFDDVKELRRQAAASSAARPKRKAACCRHWQPSQPERQSPVISTRSMTDTATVTAPTVRPITAIAMAAGTTERAISTAVSLAATKGTGACKRNKIYIAYTKNKAGGRFGMKRPPAHFIFSCIFSKIFSNEGCVLSQKCPL